MTMTVFDFENREVKIELPDKPIKAISVTVLSGDETGTVIFDDGATVDFDASYWRICDFFDGSYTVIEEQVSDWLAFRPSDGRTAAYLRAGTFFLMARVTNHAARRTKERLGLPKKLSHKNAENALRYGIRHSDTSGSLNRYISALYWKHETANNVRIYCNNVYIFHGETLITIFPLPQKYRKTAARVNRKTTERGEFDENS